MNSSVCVVVTFTGHQLIPCSVFRAQPSSCGGEVTRELFCPHLPSAGSAAPFFEREVGVRLSRTCCLLVVEHGVRNSCILQLLDTTTKPRPSTEEGSGATNRTRRCPWRTL